MKRFAVAFVVAGLAGGLAFAQAPPAATKLAIFDAGRISEETAEGKRVASQLNALQEKKRNELSAKEKAVQDLQQQLTAQALSLSAEKRSQMEKELQRAGLELNQAREAARSELQMEVQEAQNRFQEQLLSVVEQFGRDEGFDLILEKSLVAYANKSIDVTTAIVDRFNKMIPQAGTPPAAPPAAPAAPAPKK